MSGASDCGCVAHEKSSSIEPRTGQVRSPLAGVRGKRHRHWLFFADFLDEHFLGGVAGMIFLVACPQFDSVGATVDASLDEPPRSGSPRTARLD